MSAEGSLDEPADGLRIDRAGASLLETLDLERDYLRTARRELARMRERTLSLEVTGGDHVSAQYLAASLHRRALALLDDPGTALFFGRTDHQGGESWYIGRRHVSDDEGDPVVIDWRAEISRGFYRASQLEPMDLLRRRRFGIEQGEITAFEDEVLAPGLDHSAPIKDGASSAASGSILAREIERPRVGPMRDIVATIQPEQDALVRADVSTSVCIQGAPGTGKTAVGLHRAAWLLYAHRERLERAGVLVVGPNSAFLEHIAAVLPSLGEVQVRHTTVDGLLASRALATSRSQAIKAAKAASRNATAARAEIATPQPGTPQPGTPQPGKVGAGLATPISAGSLQLRAGEPAREQLLGEARMAELLHAALWRHVRQAEDALVVPRGARRWRVPAWRINEILRELGERGTRYEAARAMVAQRLAHAVLVLMEADGDSPDDRVQDAVARSAPVKSLVAQLWPSLDAQRVVFTLLSDRELLAEAARAAHASESSGAAGVAESSGLAEPAGEPLFTEPELDLIAWAHAPRSARSVRWTAAELALLDEVSDLLERTPSLGHVVLDEAQDLSAMQLRAVGRRCSTGSVTVLGDLAQGTTPWSADSWPDALIHLGQPEAEITELDQGFRVPSSVLDFATQLLPAMAPQLKAPHSVRSEPGSLRIERTDNGDALPEGVLKAVSAALQREGSVGLIVADTELITWQQRLAAAGLPSRVLAPAVAGRGGAEVDTDSSSGHLLDLADGHEANASRLSLVAATSAKGLEYDHVVVVEPAAIAAAEPDERTGLRRLYVVLTRAVSSLTVVHAEPLPAPLRAPQ